MKKLNFSSRLKSFLLLVELPVIISVMIVLVDAENLSTVTFFLKVLKLIIYGMVIETVVGISWSVCIIAGKETLASNILDIISGVFEVVLWINGLFLWTVTQKRGV